MAYRAPSRLVTLPPFIFHLLVFIVLLAVAGCAAPGEPQPPSIPVPTAVTDLVLRQQGAAVLLMFTLPRKTLDGDTLEKAPDIEIFRSFVPNSTARSKRSAPATQIYTVPSDLVDTYLSDGRIEFTDPFAPKVMAAEAGQTAVYVVRTRASKRRSSQDSNIAEVKLYPVPEPVRNVQFNVTQNAVELTWTPPATALGGGPLPEIAGYRIYRAEVTEGAEAAALQSPRNAKLNAPAELLGTTLSTTYRDTQFEFGRAYIYTVRSVAQFEDASVESNDSAPIAVAPRDTFPPAAPKNLVALAQTATPAEPARIELSWAISPETDLAGYNVYRSENPAERGTKLNPALVLAPTFRDTTAAPGRRYIYTVTAVDKAGNESALSAPVEAALAVGLNP